MFLISFLPMGSNGQNPPDIYYSISPRNLDTVRRRIPSNGSLGAAERSAPGADTDSSFSWIMAIRLIQIAKSCRLLTERARASKCHSGGRCKKSESIRSIAHRSLFFSLSSSPIVFRTHLAARLENRGFPLSISSSCALVHHNSVQRD